MIISPPKQGRPDDPKPKVGQCQVKSIKTSELHQWGFWAYISPDSCRQERVCQHCQKRQMRPGPHTWGRWIYFNLPDSWRQRRVCRRCGAQEERLNQPADATEQLKLRLAARLQAGETVQAVFDELVAAAPVGTGRTIARYQAKAILGAAALPVVTEEIGSHWQADAQEEVIKAQLISRYGDYVLFPQEWVNRVLEQVKGSGRAVKNGLSVFR